MTGNWAVYSWPPAIVLAMVMVIFLMDLGAERYVESKYGAQNEENVEDLVTGRRKQSLADINPGMMSADDIEAAHEQQRKNKEMNGHVDSIESEKIHAAELYAFRQQIAAFLILEFGVIFHSVSPCLFRICDMSITDHETGHYWTQPWRRWR